MQTECTGRSGRSEVGRGEWQLTCENLCTGQGVGSASEESQEVKRKSQKGKTMWKRIYTGVAHTYVNVLGLLA